MKARRKITLQLVPLLDLMLVILFLQFMELDERATQAVSAVEQQREQLDAERASIAQERREAEQITEKAFDQRDLVGQLAAELFNLPDAMIEKLLKQRFADNPPSDDEIAAMQQEFRKLRGRRGQEVLKHLLTFNEIRKRCDVWELYAAETGITTMKTGEIEVSFRAETPREFAAQVFAHYRSLAQPKSLVLIVFSYGNIRELTYEAAVKGLPLAVDLMKDDTAGRTRFEYAVLGADPKRPK